MSIELYYGVRYRQRSPLIRRRYFAYRVEGTIEGRFMYRADTDSVNLSLGRTETATPGEARESEADASVSADIYSACEDSITVSIEEKLGTLYDFMTGSSDKTPEQVIAEITNINISWRGARGGRWENYSATASIAPFAAFVNDATFLTLSITGRFERTLMQLSDSRAILLTGTVTFSVPLSATAEGIARVGQIFFNAATRTVNVTLRVGSWMSRTFAATGATGDAVVLGGVVAGGAIAGSAVSTAFCMWLIDNAQRAGRARGLTNQMASGYVRYLFDRDNIFANLVERRGDRYNARVRGGNQAHRDARATNEEAAKSIWKLRLFPERNGNVSDGFVRSNMGIAIDRMTVILEASGNGYSA
jgi:hypothetical protein